MGAPQDKITEEEAVAGPQAAAPSDGPRVERNPPSEGETFHVAEPDPLDAPEDEATAFRRVLVGRGDVRGADEGHGFRKKKNLDFQFYATVMFMKQYLLK